MKWWLYWPFILLAVLVVLSIGWLVFLITNGVPFWDAVGPWLGGFAFSAVVLWVRG